MFLWKKENILEYVDAYFSKSNLLLYTYVFIYIVVYSFVCYVLLFLRKTKEYIYIYIYIYTRIVSPPKAGHEHQRTTLLFWIQFFRKIWISIFLMFLNLLKMYFRVFGVFWTIYWCFECFYEFRCRFLYIWTYRICFLDFLDSLEYFEFRKQILY